MVMVFPRFAVVAQRARPLRVPVLVVAISALVALIFTIATRPAAPEPPEAAGEASIRLMLEEHALVAAYVRDSVETQRAAAERGHAEMRAAVAAGAHERAIGESLASETAKVQRPQVAAAPTATTVVAGPPLPLQAPAAASQPAPLVQHARAVLATAERIPQWVRNKVEDVADWAIIGPVRTITERQERRFL
jgi:hypothetical protein